LLGAKDDSMIRFGGIEPSSAQIEISTVYGDREYAGGGGGIGPGAYGL